MPVTRQPDPRFVCFFNGPRTADLHTLSLHDALPISWQADHPKRDRLEPLIDLWWRVQRSKIGRAHVELQSPDHLVCRLLLEKKNSPKRWPATSKTYTATSA